MAAKEANISAGDSLVKSAGQLVSSNLTTAKRDAIKLNQTDGTEVHREAVLIADPEDSNARANVVQLSGGKHAQLVLDSEGRSVKDTLEGIYEQNERIIMMLESIAE